MLTNEILEFIKEKLSITSVDTGISVNPLTEGRSGAEVYAIKVNSRKTRLSGNYVVKVYDAVANEDENEGSKAKRLHQYAPKFSRHLVKVEAEHKLVDKNIIIYSQANNSVRDTIAFSELDAEHIAIYTKRVSYEILSLLNEEVEYGGTAEDFFRCLLSKQLGENGRFVKRIEDLLDNPDAQCVALNGVVYPNPLYYVKNIHIINQKLSTQYFFKGVVHGDLHGYNLLASDNTYSVIDYDSVSTNSYLFYDHAYFEFSIFYDKSKDNDLKRWCTMLECLITPSLFTDAKPCENFLEYVVRNAICGGIKDWVDDTGREKLKDDIELQFIMSRIAAGINFFCKKTCAEKGMQVKVLFYIAYCFKILLNKIEVSYDFNDISSLCNSSEYTDTEDMWEGFVKFRNYIPILITDGLYTSRDYDKLKGLCAIDWHMIIDISSEQSDSIIYRSFLNSCKTRVVQKINVVAGEKAESFNSTLNVLSITKALNNSYSGLWRSHGKSGIAILKKLFAENPQVPLIFIFDCSRDSIVFRNQLLNNLCDINLPGGTRFVSLRTCFSDELKSEIQELETSHKWRFIEYIGATLAHVAQTCNVRLNEAYSLDRYANLPALDGVYTFNDKDLISFESCIELVYSGCEHIRKNEMCQVGFDMSIGDSFGEAFYKGNEATWNDIANHRDLLLFEEKKYEKILRQLLILIEEKSPRVKTTILLHGAGTGGTTLSKRILWDMREYVPCARLKKYSPKAVDILMEIYQKTGKSVLLSVESGSTVITEEELINLKNKVYAQNGKLVILLVKRVDSIPSAQDEKKTAILASLSDTMPIRVAENFRDIFSAYTAQKEDGKERLKYLNAITGRDDYKDQRSPFFYGFYTFQEEYNLIDSLMRTVSDCSLREKTLLNSLALTTIFSQNVCVTFSEMRSILDIQETDDAINYFIMQEMLPTALSKLTVNRNNGIRICHKVIAEKILLLLHAPKSNDHQLDDVVFKATKDYIKAMSDIYDSDSEYVDNVLKELIIDRAYIDSEERKTKFSILVERIPLWTDRKALFDFLIEKFPENPHYYNHLARLLAIGDKKNNISPRYEEAEIIAKAAIDKANSAKSTHKTTLGCIYGQWILNDIKTEIRNKMKNKFFCDYSTLITEFSVRYSLAKTEFEEARQSVDTYDSFSYFPQINLECQIISHLIEFDLERSLIQLLEQEPVFKEWYDEHFSIAAELYSKMKEQLGDNVKFLAEAKNKLATIAKNSVNEINKQFISLLDSNRPSDKRRRRSLAYSVFCINGCNWSKVEQRTLSLAEKCFRKNLEERDEDHVKYDVETWFELYRRVENFSAGEAQAVIADYMTDGYRKEYLLYLVTFIMRQNGVASASIESINRQISETNRIARLHGLNTVREYDAYVGGKRSGVIGCPIVSISDIDRDEKSKEPINLEVFTGVVTEVEQTHGKILLDKLNLDATFIPNPSSIGEDPLRTFTREDIDCQVRLNLMFSYSGLRGWNVIKTKIKR